MKTIARFGLGWAGDRGALTAEMARQGIGLDQLIEAGLVRHDEKTGRAYELFAQRVMFPIRDRRGVIISFGGLGSGQPKYLNGPDTPVFSKRRNLYGLDLACEGARSGNPVVVVEGYMNVIALAQAGFGAAVAPLTMALTKEQLAEVWRLSSCPVLCFDGDEVGARAAIRAVELVLPLLTPEQSLQVASLPAGEDLASLIKRNGRSGFQAILNSARPLVASLYELLQPIGNTTPEQRAAFRTRLEDAVDRIRHDALRDEYRHLLLNRFSDEHRAPSRHTGKAAQEALKTPSPQPSQPAPMPQWYVSYAWGDDQTPEGRQRKEIVDRLCDAAVARGHLILRDKDVLSLGDSISKFMRRIGSGDRVFVIISDKYLRSPFCMFELSEVWRTSRHEGQAFLERVRIYALPDAKVWTPVDWANWAVYWKREHVKLDTIARKHGAVILGEQGYRRLVQMQTFYTQVADILGALSDIVQPRTFEELERYGFEDPFLP
ncbi:MAG: toprim domain-containing protein [Rhodopila sp.]